MQALKRTRYYTMNSWNGSTAPAYNLKVYNVIDRELQSKVYELMESDDFYFDINELMRDFERETDYQWQAGFNGRSGGYLVLYKGGYKEKIIYPEAEFKKDNGYYGRVYSDKYGWKTYTEAKEEGLLNKTIKKVYCTNSGVDDNEVPTEILKAFRRLALDIVQHTEYLARNCKIQEETYMVEKKRKVII